MNLLKKVRGLGGKLTRLFKRTRPVEESPVAESPIEKIAPLAVSEDFQFSDDGSESDTSTVTDYDNDEFGLGLAGPKPILDENGSLISEYEMDLVSHMSAFSCRVKKVENALSVLHQTGHHDIIKSGSQNWNSIFTDLGDDSDDEKEMQMENKQKKIRIEKVDDWQLSLYPPFQGPLPPMISAYGLDWNELLLFSSVIHKSIQPTDIEFDFESEFFGFGGEKFVMLHQTNEIEIMQKIGSSRLNPFLKDLKDIDSLAYAELDDFTLEKLFNIRQVESRRRRYAFQEEHEELSLVDAYEVGQQRGINGNPAKTGIAYASRLQLLNEPLVNLVPVVNTAQPIIGVPFKAFFRDALDIPVCNIELIQAMNLYLRNVAIQIIDLRCRSEEFPGQKPYYLENQRIVAETVDTVLRSLDQLDLIRNTAKYFVIYSFMSSHFPMRFYQIIVRFKPGLPINPVDWVDLGNSRLQIVEPDLERVHSLKSLTTRFRYNECMRKISKDKEDFLRLGKFVDTYSPLPDMQ